MVGGAVELRPEVYEMEPIIAIDEIGMQLTGLRNLEMETLTPERTVQKVGGGRNGERKRKSINSITENER